MTRGGGLGRRVAPDARDRDYPLAALLPRRAVARTSRYWYAGGWWGDQGDHPHCVGYAWTHYVEDGPVTHAGAAPVVDPVAVYDRARELDEWPGTDYDGTSVRAGVKALVEMGYVAEYRWAWDAPTVVRALLEEGPVVVGTNWYEGMMAVDRAGLLHPTGAAVGGHAYLLDGVNTNTRRVRIKNSWGRGWGRSGFAWLTLDDLALLLAEDGEAAVALETRR